MSDRYSRWDFGPLTVAGPDNRMRKAVEDHLRALQARNYSIRTIDGRRRELGEFACWLHGHGVDQPESVTPAILEQYRMWLDSHATRSASTQARALSAIRTLFHYLRAIGQVSTDPAEYLELPRLGTRVPTAVLGADEVERILAQPNVATRVGLRDRTIMETLFATGIRRNEIIRLNLEDVDFLQQRVVVHHGKGKRERMLPISQRALEWIQRYLEVRPEPATPADRRVLFLPRRRQSMGGENLSKVISEYVRRAGVSKSASCHAFRATTATMMLEAGADIRFVQEMLGHVSIQTTQLYTRVSIGALQRVYTNTHPSATMHRSSAPDDTSATDEPSAAGQFILPLALGS